MIKMVQDVRAQKVNGFNAVVNSLEKAHISAVQHIDDYHLGTRNVVKMIEAFQAMKLVENKRFPLETIEEIRVFTNGLREAIEDGDVHRVNSFREKIEELLRPWTERSDILVGS
jgi:FAD synthase